MAPYRHVDDKNALLDGLVEVLITEYQLPRAEGARAERLISTAVLGFAASEASGRFRQHDQSVIDADFAELLRWLRLVLGPARPPGRY
jgi:hypothetical protein